jgi:hypothetical protein
MAADCTPAPTPFRLREPDTSAKPRRPPAWLPGDLGWTTIAANEPEECRMDATPETMSQPMDGSMTGDSADGTWIESPVDDATYDLLMALSSKLEAIDTYRTYAEDGQPELWQELASDERRHAERLLEALRQRIAVR